MAEVFASNMMASGPGSEKYRRKQERAANHYIDEFFIAQVRGQSFQTEEEAIQALAPVAVWFLWWVARQFAIMVIKAVWRAWNEDAASPWL
jgi:hypothetical protein